MHCYEPIPETTEAAASDVIGAAIAVHKALGPGFLERVYREALCFELTSRGGVIVELKAISRVDPIHEAIVLSYLRTTGMRLGLLMNFHAPTLKQGLKRIVL